jgi:outer membrane protein OmpA-like peptidoglycan-associated protein
VNGWLTSREKPQPVTSTPVVAELVGAGAPGATGRADPFTSVISTAERQKAHLLLGSLTRNDPATSLLMVPVGDYDVQRNDDIAQKRRQALDRYSTLTKQPSTGTVLAGLQALEAHLRALQSGPPNVVLIGDVLDIGGGVDLHDPVQRGDTARAVKMVQASGLIPSCTGWRVHVVGGSGAQNLGDTQLDLHAREIWRQLLAGCGGLLVAWDTQLITFPSTHEVPRVVLPSCKVTFVMGADVLFASGQSTVEAGAGRILTELRDSLVVVHPSSRVEIEGFADSQGTDAVNIPLSQERAAAVQTWLISHGVNPTRLHTAGHGSQRPVATNTTDAGRRLNRRVEVNLQLFGTDCSVQ